MLSALNAPTAGVALGAVVPPAQAGAHAGGAGGGMVPRVAAETGAGGLALQGAQAERRAPQHGDRCIYSL